jgi:hypothetical protein
MPKIRFGWISKMHVGVMDYDKNQITINLVLMVVGTYIHEMCHYRHEKWSEERVLIYEANQLRRMTVRDIKKLYRQIVCQGRK